LSAIDTLAPEEIEALQQLRTNFAFFSKAALRVRVKSGAVVPLRLNRAQLHLHHRLEAQKAKTGRVRAIIVKGRQLGCSTFIQARFYHRLWRSGRALRAFILTHEQPATDNLFGMAQRFYEHHPVPLGKPPLLRGNAKELRFAHNDCGYQVSTAGTKETGRSATFQLFHGSESAFWPNAEDHATGAFQTVGDAPGTEVIIESTAQGVGNFFYRTCQAALRNQSEFEAIFIPWFWADDYQRQDVPSEKDWNPSSQWLAYAQAHALTWEQLYWAFLKNRELANSISAPADEPCWKFMQEYPACIAAGERVGTSRGLLKIEDVEPGDHTALGSASRRIDNGEREVVRVTTSMGYSVVCTPDHRIQRADGQWIGAADSAGHAIRLQPPRVSSEPQTVAWFPFPSVVSQIAIGPNMARFLGYFMGDGCWTPTCLSIACCGQDEDVVEDVRRVLTSVIGEPTSRVLGTKKGCVELRVGRQKFGGAMNAMGVLKPDYPLRKVSVPECIFRSPPEIIREFLSALFESDGFAGYGTAKVSLFSKHTDFLRDVQLLLLSFGITCRRTAEKKMGSHGRIYLGGALTLRAAETRLFIERIGFIGKRKRSRLLSYSPSARGRPRQDVEFSDTVVSVEAAGMARVYDLSIPGEHRFDASGIVVHNCFDEAFQSSGNSFIPATSVLRARKAKDVIGSGPIILGIDPARSGDKVGIIDRCGRRLGERVCLRMDPGGSVTYVAAQVEDIINRIRPDMVNIDVGSNGAGVYDILVDHGHRNVNAINFGSNPIGRGPTGDDLYFNRRAEMWDGLRGWFDGDLPVRIPDDDGLQGDLTAAQWGPGATRYNTSNELVLEEKAAIKARLGASPDLGDACALTFAVPYANTMTSANTGGRLRKRRSKTGY
jgi:hypothetical protein